MPTHLAEQESSGNDSLGLMRGLLQNHESTIEFSRGNIDGFQTAHKEAGYSARHRLVV